MIEVVRTEVFAKWFERLRDENAQARIARRVDRLEAGNAGDVKSLGDGVSEMRIDYGPGYRLYTARHGDTVVILLCGGDKSSQRRDIQIAKGLLRDIENGVGGWSN